MDPKEIKGNRISYIKSLGFKEDNMSDDKLTIACKLLSDSKASQITTQWKCQGISMQGEKVREFMEKRKSQGKGREFCCKNFVFSQSEHPNLKIFLGGMPPVPQNSLGHK